MHRIVLVPLQIQGDGQNIGISVQGPISQVKYITIQCQASASRKRKTHRARKSFLSELKRDTF